MTDFSYKMYVTNAIHLYGQGQTPVMKWSELFSTQQQDTRTGDEVATDLIERFGLTVIPGDNSNECI